MSIRKSDIHDILILVENEMKNAYHSVRPVCCGKSSTNECCGDPVLEWSPESEAVMDALQPIREKLIAVLASKE